MRKIHMMGFILVLSVSLLLTACGNSESSGSDDTASVSEAVDYTIVGIEPGAGTMDLANQTLETYDNLAGWELLEGSTTSMLTELGTAIDNEEPIVVTGWTPHYMFATYDLKYLEDPEGTFGAEEDINTIARTGFEEDMPNAYGIMDRFHWEPEDMEEVMLEAQDESFEIAASNWIENNQDTVNEWIGDAETVDGESISIVSTPWDSERASSEVVKQVLEGQGYEVEVTPVDPAVMFQALADGESDVSVAPWLPNTHAAFYEMYKDDLVDLGPNLSGTRIGLVVPAYMDIDSIEDLEPNE